LAKDITEDKLQRGDLATIVDIHPANGGEVGYSIEVFNALGETIACHHCTGIIPRRAYRE
jgi:hypothetical protein